MIYTSNHLYGIKELKQKLPLLLVPLVFSSTKPLTGKELFLILVFFCFAVLVSSFYSTYLFFSNFVNGGSNIREISPFISHIRLGLMVNLSLFFSIFFVINPPYFRPKHFKFIFLAFAVWFTFFIFLLQSLTGIFIFFVTAIFFTVYFIFNTQKNILKVILFLSLLILLITSFVSLYVSVKNYFIRHEVDHDSLPALTVNGNNYQHITDNYQYENGHRVWLFLCWPELEEQWAKRSVFPYDGNDKLEQPLKLTLIRYLTSKGLTKDSLGIANLDDIDIKLIEAGSTSVIFKEHRIGLYPRLYQLLWEIDQYINFGSISGSPLIQRLVYIKASLIIINQNFWFGVGTGDFVDAFRSYYADNEPNLLPSFWYLSHNQFLTQWVALGFFGFLIFLVGWFAPFFLNRKHTRLLPLSFLIIFTLSMLNEDTLETHVGVSLAALFYGLFVFGTNSLEHKN